MDRVEAIKETPGSMDKQVAVKHCITIQSKKMFSFKTTQNSIFLFLNPAPFSRIRNMDKQTIITMQQLRCKGGSQGMKMQLFVSHATLMERIAFLQCLMVTEETKLRMLAKTNLPMK